MSQHSFRTVTGDGAYVTVTLGYDRPLDYVFCTVCRDGAAGDPVYSNLDDDRAGIHLRDVEYFRGVLAKLGIDIPERMFLEVRADQKNRVGNRSIFHSF